MNAAHLVTAITAAAVALSEGKSAEELAWMGAVFTQLGDTLSTISAQKSLCESAGKPSL